MAQIKLYQQDVTARAWVSDAECAKPEHDPDIWFPEQNGTRGHMERAENKAISICGQCPVLEECLIYACRYRLSQERIYGVWAGRPASWFDDRKKVAMTLRVLEERKL